jgi:hypothetical protein
MHSDLAAGRGCRRDVIKCQYLKQDITKCSCNVAIVVHTVMTLSVGLITEMLRAFEFYNADLCAVNKLLILETLPASEHCMVVNAFEYYKVKSSPSKGGGGASRGNLNPSVFEGLHKKN